jgi:hypothetical protein
MGRLRVAVGGRSGRLRRRRRFVGSRRGMPRRLWVPWVAGTMFPAVAWALAGCGPAVGAPAVGSAPTTAAAPAVASAGTAAVAPALGSGGSAAVAPALASAGVAGAVQTLLTRAGNGWALALYANGRDVSHSRVTLYLTSPVGATYTVHVWRHGTQFQLAAWSPDRSMAILQAVSPTGGVTVVHLMTLTSGATTSFLLPAFSRVIGYAQPDGASVFVAEDSGIYRYSLTGAQLARLSDVSGQANDLGSGGAVMFRGGREVVVPAHSGLSLVSSSGVLLRTLLVPHPRGACLPVRWNSPGVLVATCTPPASSSGPQVFYVPVSGASPVAVSPVRDFTSGDYGDVDAWKIGGSTYLQAEQSCGAGFLASEGASGAVTPVAIPGNPESTVVDGVYGHQMLITETGCENRNALAVLDLGTHTAQTILSYGTGAGAFGVVAYDANGGQP